MSSRLFSPWTCRGVTLRNRIGVAPMCQYSSIDGMPNDWHLVHLGSRAIGGAGLVIVEASAVSPAGRITPADAGIWNDVQADAFGPIVRFMKSHGAVAGIQLAHAGRKGSTQVPWQGKRGIDTAAGGWPVVAPSALAFSTDYPLPQELTAAGIDAIVADFAAAARRSVDAGFEVIELHAGHGYLIHEFLSPVSNRRSDGYGRDFEGRCRLPLCIVRAVRAALPERIALFVRLSVTDWLDDGWTVEESVALARLLGREGVDLIDCSSGSILPTSRGSMLPGFQVPLAQAVRSGAGIPTAAVGGITDAQQAEQVLQSDACDLVLMARALLRDPYWPRAAAAQLGAVVDWPPQYQRAVA